MPLSSTLLPKEPWTDTQVIERVRAGEVQLFELLMRRHNQRIYRAVRSILHDESAAEDAMQSAYLQAFAHLAEFQSRAQFATWLTRIAIHEALALRRRAQRAVVEDVAVMTQVAGKGRSPEETTLDDEYRRVLSRAIDQLPEHFRTVFVLRQVQELTVEETAQCLDLKVETVKTRLHRARALLRKALTQRLSPSLAGLLPFEAPRCDRVVSAVLSRILPP
jgi:RNA polymerase sigma-70 factor (ECF subfamily)